MNDSPSQTAVGSPSKTMSFMAHPVTDTVIDVAEFGLNRGFLYNGSTFTDINYPGAIETNVYGIYGSNIVGYATVGVINRQLGFLYNGSTFKDIIYPGADFTQVYGIG